MDYKEIFIRYVQILQHDFKNLSNIVSTIVYSLEYLNFMIQYTAGIARVPSSYIVT